MALVFEQLLTPSMGDASYLVGDDSAHVAAVIDPQLDVARVVAAARKHAVAIRYVVETHVHEDFASGAYALARETGAELCVSGHDAPARAFADRLLHDGDTLELGKIRLTARHTPGHTPEHIALVMAESNSPPLAVFSGGSLLADTAGRTDLLGPDRTDELTAAQFRTLRNFFLGLDDGMTVYPTHVHGSPCGAAIGDRVSTTIGHERAHNPLLKHGDEEAFARALLSALPPKPRYYARLKETNTGSPPLRMRTSAPALPPREFMEAAVQEGHRVIDTRHMLAFGGGYIEGAWNFGAAGHLSIQAGWMLDADCTLLLVLDADEALPEVLAHLARTDFRKVAGYLAGGMTAWCGAGLDLHALGQLHVEALADRLQDFIVVDVRSSQEFDEGHVPGARHIFLPDLERDAATLDPGRPIAVYCDSGYRASIGASLLRARGFDAFNVPGSWQAWRACRLPQER